MLLLALDTSGAGVAVALSDGEAVLAQRFHAGPRQHAELLAPSIAAVLDEAGVTRSQLTDLVVGVGPGPFTGLRVGLVTARALGLALVIPVRGVCSLDALALAAVRQGAVEGPFVVATDARRREVFWAGYLATASGAVERTQGPDVAAPASVPLDGRPVVGRGAVLYGEALGAPIPAAPLDVTGAAIAHLAVQRLASGVPLEPPDPLYLRRPDAVAPGARKRVLK